MSEQYPTDKELENIINWDPNDFHGLMEFIHPLWAFGDWGWKQNGNIYYISTAGWSGNESIIGAMLDNQVWWAMFWHQSRRGGHYVFAPISEVLPEDFFKRKDKS
jgi:hypothetical protein